MAFSPDKITKQHILDAVKIIDTNKIVLKASTGYDVIINGKPYPPKEVLRYAHELLNGERIWHRSGGEPTNKYFEAFGFKINIKSDNTLNEQHLSGIIWKLDCIINEKPSFYNDIKEEEIIIGVDKYKNKDSNYLEGDLVIIREGFRVKAIARIKEIPKSINSNAAYNEQFSNVEFENVSGINYAPAEWYELNENDRFDYTLTKKGIRKVQDEEIIKNVFALWKNRSSTHVVSKKLQKSKYYLNMPPKNIILYGPPGTGKTYNSIDKAVELGSPERFDSNNHAANKNVFDELRKTGQIDFVTFHQNYSYEDFVVGISPDVTSGTLRFDKREGVFKQLVEKAKQNWLSASNKKAATIDFNFVFNRFFSKLIEEEVNEVVIQMKSKKFRITSTDMDEGRIKFTKQSGGTGHDLLVKNLKAIYDGNLEYGKEGLGIYYYPLVEQLKEFAKTLQPQTKENESLKNFVLVIDEINRANISKVFGELITLLEDDKRLGAENELKITLPNGEREFGVPPNLYIIGTMNTADKSIALIDIALRRRFEFIGFYPLYDGYDSEAISLLKKINEAIFKEKKSADYLIGHAYFMKLQPIHSVLKNKVVPLLMEYFSGKIEIVSRIFIGSGWNVSYDATNYNWNILPE